MIFLTTNTSKVNWASIGASVGTIIVAVSVVIGLVGRWASRSFSSAVKEQVELVVAPKLQDVAVNLQKGLQDLTRAVETVRDDATDTKVRVARLEGMMGIQNPGRRITDNPAT